MNSTELVLKKFKELFNEDPLIVRSPGRVNLIGEHTDYNMGFVLPAAIDKAIYFAITPRNDETCSLFSLDMNDSIQYQASSIKYQASSIKHQAPSIKYQEARSKKQEKSWPNYLMGVVDQLNKSGYNIKGFNCVFGGDIPIGAGLSSSAAIGAGLAFALNHIFNLGIDKLSLVKLAQKSENEFVGVNCGIMDQYINIFGVDGNVLRIDCRSLECEYFPFDYKNVSIVLFNTNISHSLASSEYNKRRRECGEGVEIIKKEFPQIQSLRDVSLNLLTEFKNKLNPVIYRRCKYVVEENSRLLDACDALKVHNLKTFGALMYQTHEGLSKDYEVSCKELDFLVELTKDSPNIYGSRMMGGGFGGCTINLIENNAIETVSKSIAKMYKQRFNLEAKTYVTKISGGTSIVMIKEDATI